MVEDEKNLTISKNVAEPVSVWANYRLSGLLLASVLIATGLTVVSVYLYNNSGAAQLDLSRPGYRSVSDKVEQADAIDEYSASGDVNKETIIEFMELYDAQAAKAKEIEAFKGDPLNPEVLEFGSATLSE